MRDPRALPRRVEFQALGPGDLFEYRLNSRNAPPEVRRDRVLARGIGSGRHKRVWRARTLVDYIDGREEGSMMTLYTEVGQTGDGYVTMQPSVMVTLLERGRS